MEQLAQFAPLLILLAIFYFLVLRPQRVRQREVATMQAGLEVGAVVMLTSGVFGELVYLGEQSIRVRVAPTTEITVLRVAVAKRVSDEDIAAMRAEGSVAWERV